MQRFPAEFSAALKRGRLRRRAGDVPISHATERLRWFPLALDTDVAVDGIRLLETHIAQHLRCVRRPINPETIASMTQAYSEMLPKTTRNASVILDDPQAEAYAAAQEIGLIEMLGSRSLHAAAEEVSGFRLCVGPGFQVIRYEHGDYVGPHNDHHPVEEHLRNGYVDLQITLTNADVERQYLIHEFDGWLNRPINVGIQSGVSISRLPIWHQVTPLVARKGKETKARRWLLLVSFIDR